MSDTQVKSSATMTEDAMIASLEQIAEALIAKYTKPYSADKVVQLKAHLATTKQFIESLRDSAANEEDSARKAGVIQRMVLAGRELSEAQAAVEAGER